MYNRLKPLFSIVVILLLIWIVIWFVGKIRTRTADNMSGFEAIPGNAAFVFQSQDAGELFNRLSDSHVWDKVSYLPGLNQMQMLLQRLDSLSTENNAVEGLLKNSKLMISAHATNQKSPDFLIGLFFTEQPSMRELSNLAQGLFSSDVSVSSTRKYEGYPIESVKGITMEGFSETLSFTLHGRLLLLSFSDILLENSIRQLQLRDNISNQPAFQKLHSTAGKNVPANLFIQHKELANFFTIYAPELSSTKKRFLRSYSDWSVLDLKIKDDVLLLSGFTNQTDSLDKYLSVFSKQTPQRMQLQTIAPSNTRSFISIGFEDIFRLYADYSSYLELIGSGNSHSVVFQSVSDRLNLDIHKQVLPILGNEAGIVFTAFAQQTLQENTFGVIQVKSTDAFRRVLSDGIDHLAKNENKQRGDYISRISIDHTTNYEVYHLPDHQLMQLLFGNLFQGLSNDYFAFIGDFVILGSSRSAISKFIHFNVLGKTLESDVQYQNLSQYFSTQSNITLYSNIPNSIDIYSHFLSSEMVDLIRSNEDVFTTVRGLGVQYHFSGEYFFNTIFLKYLDKYTESTHTVWETLLDTTIWFKPTFVKNHYTQENEIFVQDNSNNIYLINKIGRVLWKIVLDEPIIGNVYQIDFYKNNKLQLLFATRSKIHLIDRNGNYVENYPVNLRSETTAGLSLFDYENNRNYRLCVPTNDKKIYLYTLDGKLVSGWTFGKTESIISHPVQHIRIGDKDYIVANDTYKTYILNRRGETRVAVNRLIPFSQNNYYQVSSARAAKAKLAITDTSGTVFFVYFDGTIEERSVGAFSSDHYFMFEDVNGDYQKDLIFLDKNRLSVFGQNGKEIYTYKIQQNAAFSPIFFDFGLTDKKIGLVSQDSGEIFLINNDGSLYDGFPLRGTTPFSIGRLAETSRFNLIVGNSDNFLLNYSVQ